jgi:O-antigen ligase
MAMSLLPLTAMVYTGSRGGIIAFLTGVVVYALPYRRSKRKMAAILGVAIAVIGIICVVINDQMTLSRFERSYYTGETAHRDSIYAGAVEMISAKPLLGWHPIVFNYELGGYRGRKVIDAHNLFFHLLLEVGIVGAIPFLVGLGLCLQAAWTARANSLGLLPLVWLITMIVANIAGTWLIAKIFWVVLALNLASAALTVEQHKRRNIIFRIILQKSQKKHIARTTEIA